jgi:hypothetical protein
MAFDRALTKRILTVAGVGALLALGGMAFHRWWTRPGPGRMLDEARLSGRVTFAAPDEDYFHDADGGLDLTLDEIQGATRGWCGARATIACGTGWRANRRERSTC